MTRFRAVGAALVMLAAITAAVAQGTGGLVVIVTDASGGILPGATVTISHEAGYIKPYTTLTNGQGRAEFPVLRPGGGYIVEVSMPSFGQRRETDVRVPIGESLSLPVQLAEQIQERVQVVATEDVVELENTTSKTRFSSEFIQDLPVPGRFYQNVLTLAPGVQDPDGDGNPTVHGSRSRDFRAQVGGVTNVNPLTGQSLANVNADSIEAMEVITGGAGVEFGRAQGGFGNIIQKQGTNELEGNVGILFETSLLNGFAKDRNNLPDPEFRTIQPSLTLSGPIIKDKLWFRLSHDYRDAEFPINIPGTTVVQSTVQQTISDQLTWQVSPRNKLEFVFEANPIEANNLGVTSINPPESTLSTDTEYQKFSGRWVAPYSPKLLVTTTVATQTVETSLFPTGGSQFNNCAARDTFLATALCTNLDTGQVSGRQNLNLDDQIDIFTLSSSATFYAGRVWGANHTLKFGFSVENERFFRTNTQRPQTFFFILDTTNDSSGGGDPQEVPILATNLSVPETSSNRATGTNWALYIEDEIKPRDNLVIKAGLRIDREEIYSDGIVPIDPAVERQIYLDNLLNPLIPTAEATYNAFTAYEGNEGYALELSRLTGQQVDVGTAFSTIVAESTRWYEKRAPGNINIGNTNLSPFLSVSWDPWSTGKNKFAASFRRYYDKTILAIPLFEVGPPTGTVAFESPTVGLDGLASGPLSVRGDINTAVTINSVDRDLSTPFQDEFRLVYERELWAETSLKVEYIQRNYKDQFQTRDVNHVADDFGRCAVNSLGGFAVTPSPGEGAELQDFFNGGTYIDTDPGDGDGRLDDCIGKLESQANNPQVLVQTPDGVTDLYTLNPAFNQISQLGNVNFADYEGIVLEFVRRQYRGWEMNASYTWSEAQGNGEDFNQFLGLDPSLLDREFGFQSNDQRHVVKVNATSITPWGFRLGTTVTWQSGLPYSILQQRLSFDAIQPQYALDPTNPARLRLSYPTGVRNSGRNPSQWLVNVRLTKELTIGRSMNLQLTANIINLLNDGTYFVYNPDFEQGFQINGTNGARLQFGRRFELGARLSF